MKLNSLLSHCALLLKIINKSAQPPDNLARSFFRQKKYIGSSERKFISETVFCSLRVWNTAVSLLNSIQRKYQHSIGADAYEILIVQTVIWLTYHDSEYIRGYCPEKLFVSLPHSSQHIFENELRMSISETLTFCNADEFFSDINQFFEILNSEYYKYKQNFDDFSNELFNSSAERVSIDKEILKDWLKHYGKRAFDIAEALLEPADVCLRLDRFKMSRDEAIEIFQKDGIPAKKGALAPDSIILEKRVKILEHPLYRSGIVEIQDEGSQIIAYSLELWQGCSVLDACAGAGGKSLHIAAILNDNCRIVSSDIEYKRLSELSKRAAKCGYKSINSVLLKSGSARKNEPPELYRKKFDCVLVDAPCSGIGTSRRNPMPKYRLTGKLTERLSARQFDILSEYSKYVRSGGTLVYSTCSLMPQENISVVEKFLSHSKEFEKGNLYESFANTKINPAGLKNGDYCLTLNPADHNCDGFFIAKLVKK